MTRDTVKTDDHASISAMPLVIYLDTFVFMDILSGNHTFIDKLMPYLTELKTGNASAVVSAVLFAELTYHLARKRSRDKAEEIVYYIAALPNLTILPVTPAIAQRAGALRARYRKRIEKKLTYFDAIHLATAIDAKCTVFLTGDRGFREITELKMEIY